MSSVLTISSVSTATDEVTTSVPHGLTTGDGPVAIYTAAGTYPSPLVAATSYWFIRTGASTGKLATSNPNAMAGTAIDITTTGSGTLQLLVGLPYRVPRIAAALTQVVSGDFNDTWNSLVALWNLLTGQAQTVWTAVTLAVGLTMAPNQNVIVSGAGQYKHGTKRRALAPKIVNNTVGLTWTLNAGDFVTSTGSGSAQFDVPCEVGERITGIEVLAFGDGAVDATITLDYVDSSLAATNLATLTDTNRAAAWGFAIPSVTPHTMADGERLRLTVNANAANYRVGAVKLLYDR